MKRFLAILLGVIPITASGQGVPSIPWAPHDSTRPLPPVVRPAPQLAALFPPSDAVVLFDGAALLGWRAARDSAAAGWRVVDGALEVAPGTGDIETRQGFGDCQLHIEWMAPSPRSGEGQEPGNSGVYLMGRYEVQVLDSYQNRTYADGLAGAVYGQYPPLANPSRPPGEWQSYDIVFRRPRFSPQGRLQTPAYVTVIYNGVLVQDHVALTGPTSHRRRPPYEAHPDRLPLRLQDHGQRVRFRSVWIRNLEGP